MKQVPFFAFYSLTLMYLDQNTQKLTKLYNVITKPAQVTLTITITFNIDFELSIIMTYTTTFTTANRKAKL